jgi:hypothetical protein
MRTYRGVLSARRVHHAVGAGAAPHFLNSTPSPARAFNGSLGRVGSVFSRFSGGRAVIRVLVVVVAFVGLGRLQAARAAVFSRDWKAAGDGLLTYDDVNRREWLDLTESRLATLPGRTLNEKYQGALAELVVGGRWQGFTIAKLPDLVALAISAGIDTSTENYPVNQASTAALIPLVGRSLTTTPDSPNLISMGLLDEIGPATPTLMSRLVGSLWVIPDGVRQRAGLGPIGVPDIAREGNTGVWLYREVPEPNSLVLQVVAMWCLCKPRGRKRSARC